MKTDRELLEAAAKAAGVEGKWHEQARAYAAPTGWLMPNGRTWNPLADDGDALRLFCALPWMCIETSDVGVTVRERVQSRPSRVLLMWTEWLELYNGDTEAATRRAIVRAAAAMVE